MRGKKLPGDDHETHDAEVFHSGRCRYMCLCVQQATALVLCNSVAVVTAKNEAFPVVPVQVLV